MGGFKRNVIFVSLTTALILSLALFGCGGSGGGSGSNGGDSDSGIDTLAIGELGYEAQSCDINGKNEFVYKMMNDTYYWYNQTPNVDYTSYSTPESLLTDLKYSTYDRWSYIADYDDYYSYYEEGTYIGFGFNLYHVGENHVRFRFIYKNSPCGKAGIDRGDKLLEINGYPIETVYNDDLWDSLLGPDETGFNVTFKVEKLGGETEVLNLAKDWVYINTVLHNEIIERNDLKIGYIVFKSFTYTANEELEEVFNAFQAANVNELILDLRYNGGGKLSVANYLASMIAGSKVDPDKIYQKYVHNDKYSYWDRSYYFKEVLVSLDLERVFIITTNDTCSASESIINNLQPYMQVVVIGDDNTCGKPCGMYPHDFCDKVIVAIEFANYNTNNEGDYFDGIPPNCYEEDDLTHRFGDNNELLLKATLDYITSNTCNIEPLSTSSYKNLEQIHKNLEQIQLEGLRREINAF